jgi:hypothetical protein
MMLRVLLAALAAVAGPPAQAQFSSSSPDTAALLKVQSAAAMVAGTYTVEGRNVDGSPYRGMVLVQARGDGTLEFFWRIGSFHRGIGTLDGKTVTVDFGDAFPAVYEIQSDGSLTGTWANGRASERLTPVGVLRT